MNASCNPQLPKAGGGRAIRSYVLRHGRLTPGQQAAVDRLLPDYGLAVADGRLDLARVFQGKRPIILDIGFGAGDSLAEQARQHPEAAFIGVEVYKPGIGQLLRKLQAAQLTNVRVFWDDCINVLQQALPDNCLDKVQVFFPDPWPKAKHRKRRLVNADFLRLVKPPLKPGGILHLATDWQPYAQSMQSLLAADKDFRRVPPPPRPPTRFEARGHRQGQPPTDLAYRLQS